MKAPGGGGATAIYGLYRFSFGWTGLVTSVVSEKQPL